MILGILILQGIITYSTNHFVMVGNGDGLSISAVAHVTIPTTDIKLYHFFRLHMPLFLMYLLMMVFLYYLVIIERIFLL
jgi:hypothetical protein